ncbi:hypothetical protein [Domibacillus indicus]|uniref:hypothetical protein n=1 Tax=Domibacillus indicus TaxID=1437523 RepID=UPI0012E083AF|nr:hypothetical protein [Domibacillus indicus]
MMEEKSLLLADTAAHRAGKLVQVDKSPDTLDTAQVQESEDKMAWSGHLLFIYFFQIHPPLFSLKRTASFPACSFYLM